MAVRYLRLAYQVRRRMNDDYILLIDDDEEVLGTLSRALKPQGYEVQQARSGAEGLRKIQDRIPDLVILDVMMPGMDGLEVCRIIRNDHAWTTFDVTNPCDNTTRRTSTNIGIHSIACK